MKVVILAGGMGTRIGEESHLTPKPMIEIGNKPILIHLMTLYSLSGFNDFIICLGYKGHKIKEYFANYHLYNSDLTFDFENRCQNTLKKFNTPPWKVTLVETGLNTMTGGRLSRIKPYLDPHEDFMVTYGDGLSDVNLKELVKFHQSHGKLATVTGVFPPGRFGILKLDRDNTVKDLSEKPPGDGALINGGFFVFKPKVMEFMGDDQSILEQGPLQAIAAKEELKCYTHHGFWQCMDTLRDKNYLEKLWNSPNPPWPHENNYV